MLRSTTLSEEDDLERSAVVNSIASVDLVAQLLNDEVDAGYTDWLPGHSAQDRHFEQRRRPRGVHRYSESVSMAVSIAFFNIIVHELSNFPNAPQGSVILREVAEDKPTKI